METAKLVKFDAILDEFPAYIVEPLAVLLDKKNNVKIRVHARRDLIDMGKEILPYIHLLLKSKNFTVRKEAVKITERIADKSSVLKLIDLLDDNESSIRWMAAEGLARIGRDSIVPLMKAIVKCGSSHYVKLGAHHVLSHVLTSEEKEKYKYLIHSLHDYFEINGSVKHEASKALSNVYRA